MKYFQLLLIALFLPFFSKAQNNFQPGYVVTLKGDTIKGFIDYREWDKSPTTISFKDNVENHNIKQLTIKDINYFSVIGAESYQKFSGTISLNIIDNDYLGYESDTTYRVDTVFFKVLQKGNNIALYSYKDQIKTRFYLGENPDYTPKELIYRIYKNSKTESNIDDHKNTIIENIYLKQLFAAANKYNSLDDELSRLFINGDYKDYYLLKVVSKINKFKKPEGNKNFEPKINYFTGAGFSFDTPYGPNGGSKPSVLPLISAGINILPKPKSQKVELRLELQLSTSKYDYGALITNTSYNLFNIALMPHIIYNLYNDPNFKIFIGGGFALIHHNYYNIASGSTTTGYFSPYSSSTFLLKAGIKTSKRVSFYVNMLTDYSVNTLDFHNLLNNTINIGFLYFWGK